MKKVLVLLLVLTLSLSLILTGCNRPASAVEEAASEKMEAKEEVEEATEQEEVTLQFMTFSANAESGISIDSLKEKFEAKNPNIKIEIEALGYGDYFTQLQTRMLGSDAPDCFETNYENFVAYADEDLLANLDETVVNSGLDMSVYNQETVKAFNLYGTQYGLPYSFSNVILIYNKDLFDQAGIDYPTDDWTWADVDEAGATIRALDDDIYGYLQPIQFFEFFKVIEQNGGSVLSEDGKTFTVNSQANIDALQHMIDRVNVTNIMPNEAQMGGMGEWDIFLSGRLGMLINGIWSFPTFTSDATFNWDIAVEPGNTQKATHFFANGLVVNAASEKQEAAFKWISYLSASEDMANFRLENNWELPPTTYENVVSEYEKVTPPANKAAVFKSLDYLITVPKVVEFNKMVDIISKELSAAVIGAKTCEQALNDAQAELENNITLD